MVPEQEQAPEAKRAALFLSYARADRKTAEQLCAALRQAGYDPWWDALIEGGARFAPAIDAALDKADAVLVLWSRQSVGSDWVRDEAASGRDRGRLVPLSLDGSEPPLGFRQYHTIALDRWNGAAGAAEIAAITRAVGAIGHAPATTPRADAGRPGWSRRGLLIGGAGAGAAALGSGVFWALRQGGGHDAAGNSIAVLPFRNLSADREQAFFAEGLAEEVRSALRRVATLRVLAATSSDAASKGDEDAPTIARKLGVAYLLEGSVQRAGTMVRIALDLTDGASGFSRWSNRVDRPMTDIFALESEIAGTVANAMSLRIAAAAPGPGGTTDVAAYEQFLRGRSLFNLSKDEATDRAALAAFGRATTLDPRFALALAARSRALSAIAAEYGPVDMKPLVAESIKAAQRAIELAPDLAEAQLAMGYALFSGRLQVAAARPFYDRAQALASGDADVILLFALYCARAGRVGEAQTAVGQALRLDPLNARTFRAAGSIAFVARQFRAAQPPLHRALELNAGISNAHALIGLCLLMLGDRRGAIAAFEAEPRAAFRLACLAIGRRRMGDVVGAKQAFDRLLSELGDSGLYQQAQVLAQWGDVSGALAALRRARVAGDSGLTYAATDPLLDPLRGSPVFGGFIKGLGLS